MLVLQTIFYFYNLPANKKLTKGGRKVIEY